MTAREQVQEIQRRVNQSVIGQERVVERLVIALLANGNVLVEGLPGLAKTRAIKSLSAALESDFSRIQFTPDLLPSDVTGGEIYLSQGSGAGTFEFRRGPVFGNLVLADEINRAPAKVQSALLEAMEERQVTVSGKRYKLPDLFMVLATQNPIEQEGTYPLPEAQMDRFLMHVRIDYPSDADEAKVLRLVRGEEAQGAKAAAPPKIAQQAVFDARFEIDRVTSVEAVESYIVALVAATRRPAAYGDKLKSWISIGASPRGSLALDRCSRVHAWLRGRDHVLPEDVQAIVHDCLRHRVSLSYGASADGVGKDAVIDEIVNQVAVAG
jgi:MoxR-like ATPase